jgi:exoribonuclease R
MFANNWLAGTLELTSKVRYGLTSRGTPIFRFIPYDKRFPPMAVGCSQRNLFYNIHAIVEPTNQPTRQGELPKATIVQTLGVPSPTTEMQVLLATYAYDSKKGLRPAPSQVLLPEHTQQENRAFLQGLTFHIDPPGCRDVDDSFTVSCNSDTKTWTVAINIADVANYVLEGSPLDTEAAARASTFYTPGGEAVQPMFPKALSESAFSLLPGRPKPTLSLCFEVGPEGQPQNPRWLLTSTETTISYTYDEAQAAIPTSPELKVLERVAAALAAPAPAASPSPAASPAPAPFDTHTIVERLMIYYNQQAGHMLAQAGVGILRRHSAATATPIQIPGVPEFLAYEAAEFCLPTDENTTHHGLGSSTYAYASSPIRRYADLLNQRAIKSLLHKQTVSPLTQAIVSDLNRRQKQAKAFQRDLFFMTNLSLASSTSVKGIVMYVNEEKRKARIWVPDWKTSINAKSLQLDAAIVPGASVRIQWYEDRGAARWKEKIVFKVEASDVEGR